MPRPKPVLSRARRDEWELHRRELSRLFIVEGIPVAQIAKYMRNEHGFDRKPKDYEYRLKKWNLRRNLHELELRFIHNELSKRKEAGRPSEIVVSGVRWSESMARGRLERHMSSCSSSSMPEQCEVNIPPDFLARVQTPSPLMLGLPEWPKELPWLQFNLSIHQALATLTCTQASRMCHAHGQEALLIQMMRPYIDKNNSKPTGHLEVDSIHPPRRVRAMLEVIAPQAHACDHETTADILHTGSYESLAVELVRLIIYFESNNMVDRFGKLLGYNVRLAESAKMMDFLRNIGFLTQANINWLGGCTDPTSQAFLNKLLVHSIVDKNSTNVLELMIPDHFDVSHPIPISIEQWFRMDTKAGYRLCHGVSWDYRPKATMLQVSCITGNISAVNFLLDLGADPYATSAPEESTPLEFAASLPCQEHATNVVALLLSKQTGSSSELQAAALEGAFRVAISSAHTELIVRLLSERERLGHGRICSHHFTMAARYADCATIRLLVDNASRQTNGPVQLPEDILFSAISARYWHRDVANDPGEMLERLYYLLAIGGSPSVPRCRHGCMGSFFLDVLIGSERNRDTEDRIGEDYVLKMIETVRKHGCPLETPKPTSSGEHRPSALQMAIQLGYARLVEYILDWGANIDFFQDEQKSARSRCKDCERDDYICTYPIKGRSPLLTALIYGEIEIAKTLLRRKPNLKLRGGEPELVMKSGDDPELVALLLLAASANTNEWKSFFEQAVMMRNPESIKVLSSMATDGHAPIDSETIMRASLITGDYDKAYQHATACGYDSRVLFEAVVQSHKDKRLHAIVEHLLQLRTHISNDEFEIRAVASAAIHHDAHLLGCLMQHFGQGPWIAEFPWNCPPCLSNWAPLGDGEHKKHILLYAVEFMSVHKDETILKALLEAPIPADEVSLQDPLGNTLLEFSVEILEQLIAAGCDPNQGRFLLTAIEKNHLEHVQALCEAHLDLNAMRDSIGPFTGGSRTAIQAAIESGSPEMFQMLLGYGADVDRPAGPFCGATCLQLAAGAGDIGLVRLLLNKGAKVNAKRSLFYGRTSVEIAAENGRLDVLKFFLLHEEPFFQTESERYQFIRSVKLAEKNGHGLLAKMLRQHINWNSDDQQLFDKMPDFRDAPCQLDDMTQRLSESEKSGENFWSNVDNIAWSAGLNNIYDIDGIEEWIGWNSSDSYSEAHSSSEGEAIVNSSDPFAVTKRPAAEFDELASDPDDLAGPSPTYDDADTALAYLRPLRVERREQRGRNLQASTINSGWDSTETALAPQAIRYDYTVPTWLNMDDNMDDSVDDVAFWKVAEHCAAISNLDRGPGMVFGGVPELHNDELGREILVPLAAEKGDVDPPHFDWGCWDEGGIFREADGLNFEFDTMELG